MTERLYYNDPYLREFTASVTSVDLIDGRQVARLDRSAFYPTSGGQPHDVGALDTVRVIDVLDADDGAVLHVIEGPLTPGASVSGRIDWARRFDHMQQHTGQHVLSAAFDRLRSARTESFHLGADYATIDLNRDLTAQEIADVEEDANRIVWEDRAVRISYVDAAEAAKLPLRKEPAAREGELRLIEVEDYDLSACGGTHVGRTGAIGVIAVTSWERFKGGTRVGFVCGGRALRAHRKLRDVTAAAGRLLSILPEELPAAIERLQLDAKDSRRTIKDLQVKLARFEADALAASAADGRVVAALDGWDQNGLKIIASSIAERPGHVAVLFGPQSGAIVIARHAASPVDSAALLRRIVQKFGGKGGGRPELAQGGGLQGDPQQIIAYLRELL
jgi:alanyl-tRNA synthetase